MEPCALCGRSAATTRHHLVPRALHRRLKRRNGVQGRDLCATIPLCRPCHATLHQTFDERDLAENYDTLEKILADERMARWRKWLSGKPDGFSPKLRSWKTARRERGR